MKYLVTSATGDLAFQSVQFLLTLVNKNDVVVTVRDLEKAEKLKVLGVEIRQADYLDESSLVEAFTGVSRVLFISSGDLSSRARQHRNVVNALISANVQFVAYTSAPKADQSTAIVAPDHKLTEELIMASGLNYAFLRNNWYLENEGMLFDAIEQKQPFVYVTGSGRAGWAKKSDYAEAAARILAGVVPSKLIYELGGQPLTYPELADILQGNREEKIALIPESAEEYAEQLKSAGLPEEVIGFIIGIQKDIKNGQLDVPSDDLEVVLGRPLTELTI
ncbi:MAG: SDR family oxidoreductase [Streptococcaceae bacterium]|jgi:NAD(P)H dehydrogenase (quinone)|nr:SDR family oxidoreductase [Streptococcaceae bacterium]MCH4176818.1 SDR family oxidoreductase [Streptococcaceae bacterium]